MNVPITGDLIVLFLALIGGVGGLWWRIEARFAAEDREIAALRQELSDYKLFVERNHVSAQVLRDTEKRLIDDTEKRLIDAIEKLATRMEAIADRFDSRPR